MPRPRRPEYDVPAFREMWDADTPLAEMAEEYGVSEPAIWKAAMRRGFPPKQHMRAA